MRSPRVAAALALTVVLLPVSASASAAATRRKAPPPLSADTARVPIDSAYGSGDFGRWEVDPLRAARATGTRSMSRPTRSAAQPELAGSRDAWHQIGNDHIVADAFNHGYVELWSQDRRYEWTTATTPPSDHFAGGYGYLEATAAA